MAALEDLLRANQLEDDGTDVRVIGGRLMSADPASPANEDWWIKRSGSGPYTISLNVRIGGTTYSIPLGDVAV